jgi:hypothetical protein
LPIDPRRRDEIAAAVAAYDSANPLSPLQRNAVPLLDAMFPIENVCQRSLDDNRPHTVPSDLHNNPMPMRLIIPSGSETHLPAIAEDAMQQTRTSQGSEAGRCGERS